MALLTLGLAQCAAHAEQRALDEPGLAGLVLAPDGTPLSGGSIVLQAPGWRSVSTIDREGHFRVVPERAGLHQLTVTNDGLAPYRVNVTVPPSRRIELPPIQLTPGTYFHAQFVSSSGEVIFSPTVRHRSWDRDGYPTFSPPDDPVTRRVDAEGRLILGPLPPGLTTLATAIHGLAQTRLTDLNVERDGGVLDGGTIVLSPGTTLEVNVVDERGAVVPNHNVTIEDAEPQSPMFFPAVRTDAQGRATFAHLGRGAYILRAEGVARCGGTPMFAARRVAVSGTGTSRTRLVIGGRAEIRVTSSAGPLVSTAVSLTPESFAPPDASVLRRNVLTPLMKLSPGQFVRETTCLARADADGRAVFENIPPGAARLSIRLPNSTHVRRVTVPEHAATMHVRVPDDLASLTVVSQQTKAPVAQALVTWTSGEGRVEALTTATGDALLEGITSGPGTLSIVAAGHRRGEAKFSEPPDGPTFALARMAPRVIAARVVTTAGEAVPDAVVQLLPGDPDELGHFAATDRSGVTTFAEVTSGTLRLVVNARGHQPTSVTVPAEHSGEVQVTLQYKADGLVLFLGAGAARSAAWREHGWRYLSASFVPTREPRTDELVSP